MQIFCKLYSRIIYCDNKTSSADVTTTADYLVGFVYKSKSYSSPELSELAYSKKLQFFSHEEGRVRPLEGNNETPFVYDYFIKDHLGNGVQRHSTMGAMGVNEANGTVGNLVVMDSESNYFSSAATVHHDILHQIGLWDRYSEPDKNGDVKVAQGYGRDIMGFGPRTAYQGKGFEFKQIHFNNFGRTHFQSKTAKKVSNKRVDKATIKNPSGI